MNKIFEEENVKHLIKELGRVQRQGWVDRGIDGCETVYDHTMSLINLCDLWNDILSINDIEHLKDMIMVHDLPEILRGDENIYRDLSRFKINKAKKKEAERKAMVVLCTSLGNTGSTLLALYDEYEMCETHDTQIGHELDKVQAVIQASVYEKAGYKVKAKDFVDTYLELGLIIQPKLVEYVKHIAMSEK